MLADFASLTYDELAAEIVRMTSAAKAKADRRATLFTVTRIGQAIPLPADPAARGELIEQGA